MVTIAKFLCHPVNERTSGFAVHTLACTALRYVAMLRDTRPNHWNIMYVLKSVVRLT